MIACMEPLSLVRAFVTVFAVALTCNAAEISLRFEPNVGQTDPSVSFFSRWTSHALFLTRTGSTLRTPSAVWKVEFAGANPGAVLAGRDPVPTASHYLVGRADKWHNGSRSYARVEYQDLYPGVSLAYSGDQERIVYD